MSEPCPTPCILLGRRCQQFNFVYLSLAVLAARRLAFQFARSRRRLRENLEAVRR